MSLSRKDDKHNADLVDEISDSFNRAVARQRDSRDSDTDHDGEVQRPAPRFVVTGDQRVPPARPR